MKQFLQRRGVLIRKLAKSLEIQAANQQNGRLKNRPFFVLEPFKAEYVSQKLHYFCSIFLNLK